MSINLTTFCGDEKYDFNVPVFQKGHLYASDGRICVRVVTDKADENHKRQFHSLPGWDRDGEAVAFPKPDGESYPCQECQGTGVVNTSDTCSACGHDIDGEEDCKACWASGLCAYPERVTLGIFTIAGRYAQKISKLPNARYIDDPREKHSVVKFVFDGGEGLVVEIKHEEAI